MKTSFFALLSFFSLSVLANDFSPHTYGYEMEFNSGHDESFLGNHPPLRERRATEGRVQEAGSIDVSEDAQKQYNLNPKGIVEWSGSLLEVTSDVYRERDSERNLERCFSDLGNLTQAFRRWNEAHSDKLAFPFWAHVHNRFDKAELRTKGVTDKMFKAWMSRIDDWVFLWRTTQRSDYEQNPGYIFMNQPYPRVSPDRIDVRGGVRVVSDNDQGNILETKYRGEGKQWDVEIRGFPLHQNMDGEVISDMKEVAQHIQKTVRHNPQLAKKTNIHRQSLLYQKAEKLEEEVDRRLRLKGKDPLTSDQKQWFAQLAHMATYEWGYTRDHIQIAHGMQNILPLMGYEYAPYLSREERNLLAKEREFFLDQMINLMSRHYSDKHVQKRVLENNGLTYIGNESSNQQTRNFLKAMRIFQRHIIKYAKRSNLYESLKNSLLNGNLYSYQSVNEEIGYLPYLLKRWKEGKTQEELGEKDIWRNRFYKREHADEVIKVIPEEVIKRAFLYEDLSEEECMDLLLIRRGKGDLVGQTSCCEENSNELRALRGEINTVKIQRRAIKADSKLVRLVREYVKTFGGQSYIQPMVVVGQVLRKLEKIGIVNLAQLSHVIKETKGLNGKIHLYNRQNKSNRVKVFSEEGIECIKKLLKERNLL